MKVRRVRVGVPPLRMDVRVAVGTGGHRIVGVTVVPVLVSVGVLVLRPLVLVHVRVTLPQVQENPGGHHDAGGSHERASGAVAQRYSRQRANEGCTCEYRARPRGTEAALRQQVKAKRQTVACRPDGEQPERGRG